MPSTLAGSIARLVATSFLASIGVACGGGADATGNESQSTDTRSAQPVQSGHLRGWPETTEHLSVDFLSVPASVAFGAPGSSGLEALWSIATTAGAGSGYFYSDAISGRSDTRVAYAASVRRVKDIRDASTFDYAQVSVGPVPAGGIVLVQHVPTARYLAIVVDAIDAVDARTAGAGPYALADVTWYLTAEGSADFSLAP